MIPLVTIKLVKTPSYEVALVREGETNYYIRYDYTDALYESYEDSDDIKDLNVALMLFDCQVRAFENIRGA